MEPEAFLAAYRADGRQQVQGIGGSSPHGGGREERNQTRLAVLMNLAPQSVAAHGKLLVYLNQPQVIHTNSGNHSCLLKRGVRLIRGVSDQAPIATAPIA